MMERRSVRQRAIASSTDTSSMNVNVTNQSLCRTSTQPSRIRRRTFARQAFMQIAQSAILPHATGITLSFPW